MLDVSKMNILKRKNKFLTKSDKNIIEINNCTRNFVSKTQVS